MNKQWSVDAPLAPRLSQRQQQAAAGAFQKFMAVVGAPMHPYRSSRSASRNTHEKSDKRIRAPPSEGWLCQRAGCPAAEGGMRNFASNLCCFRCAQPKGSAMNPPASKRVVRKTSASKAEPKEAKVKKEAKQQQQADDEGFRAQRTRSRRGRAARSSSRSRAASAGTARVSSRPASPMQQRTTPQQGEGTSGAATPPSVQLVSKRQHVRLPDDALEGLSLLLPALDPFLKLYESDMLPPPPPSEPERPEQVVERHLAGAQSAGAPTAEERAKLEAKVAATSNALTALADLSDDPSVAFRKQLSEQLAKDQTQLAKLKRAAPSAAKTRATVRLARERFLADELVREERAAKGTDNAALRRKTRQDLLEQFGEQLAALRLANKAVETEHQDLHARHSAEKAFAKQLVLAEFDAKEAAATDAVDEADPVEPPMEVDMGAALAKAEVYANQKASEREEAASLRKELADLRALVKELQPSNAGFDQVVPLSSLEPLPQLPELAPAQLRVLGNMFGLLDNWQAEGSCVPFTLADLFQHTDAEANGYEDSDFTALLQMLLGKQWLTWLPGTVAVDFVVPRQMATQFQKALGQLKWSLESGAAERAYQALCQGNSSKKRKSAQ